MEAGYISGTFFYTTLCNALDYMAFCFPVMYVDPNLDEPHTLASFYNSRKQGYIKTL